MLLRAYEPGPPLSNFIENFWLYDGYSRLHGRERIFPSGTFDVLQGQESVENGKIKATWFVVPGSGTGDLSGLRGQGGFEGEFGKGSNATLDYWFQ